MCFPLGSEEEMLWYLPQMEWNGNFQISFRLGKRCHAGHQEDPAISRVRGHTVTQSHLGTIVNGYLVTRLLCRKTSSSAQNGYLP